jgi:hypothetical protein
MSNELRRLISVTLALATTVFLFPGASAWADRIYLRNGDYVDVDSWCADGDHVLYERFGGTIGLHKDEVLRLEQKDTDPTSWQAPGSSKNPSRSSSVVDAPASPSAPSAGTAGSTPLSGQTWTPEPSPTLTKPPAIDKGKAMLASYWESQKQIAMQRMDYYANAKGTCVSRYRTGSVARACEDGSKQSYRFWNERYIVASREYEKYR